MDNGEWGPPTISGLMFDKMEKAAVQANEKFWNDVARTIRYPSQFNNPYCPEGIKLVAQMILDLRKLAGGPGFEIKPEEEG